MCCFERKVSGPNRLIDSIAWCPLRFLREPNENTRQKHEE